MALAKGDLINNGHLAFTADRGLTGDLKATTNVDGTRWGELDLHIQHAGSDIRPTTTGLTLTGGILDVKFVPNV